jgi:uncharacterized protein
MDWQLVAVGLVIGFTVGLTGMGGGALMTPVLVLVFGIEPLAAVSSDLVASLVMKPVAGAVHVRRRTVEPRLVRLLCYGSVPAAFCSAFALNHLTDRASVQSVVRIALGLALLLAVAAMLARGVVDRRRGAGDRPVTARPVVTVLVGVLGGAVVGLTSVGSGSLVIVALSLLYPGLTVARLVGTDLVQAVPLVGAAALGHLLFGDVRFDVTAALLAGALPAVYLGARLSSSARLRFVRPVLLAVLVASALALLGAAPLIPWAAGVAALAAAAWWLAGRGGSAGGLAGRGGSASGSAGRGGSAGRRRRVALAMQDGTRANLGEG